MKIALTLIIWLASFSAFADAQPTNQNKDLTKLDCVWTQAQGTQLLQNFAGIVYKASASALKEKGIALVENPELKLYKDIHTKASGNDTYNVLLIEFSAADKTTMMITTDSGAEDLPIKMVRHNDEQGNLKSCEVMTRDLLIQEVRVEDSWTPVVSIDLKMPDQTIFEFAANPVK